ncbi:MAG TPA: SDR family oxidoreductase, partial [Solirubrobacteraceae bacterium]|nr:SDR family oxidoreductase [Solirubrobacteraceae bacterium]
MIEGDVTSADLTLPADLDVIVHCAATVSFDPPIDEAFQTTLVGTVNLYTAARATGSHPHLVHISTAYVAGLTKGLIAEASLDHDVDWRVEAAAAAAARETVEASSRRPQQLEEFVREATSRHGRAGPNAVKTDAEKRRRDWVDKRLVEYGRSRARSLGWPDVYTFTKALGERAAEEVAGDLPLSIVRPSIVESALLHPYPGWIEGFKMAEPVILAYGRGALPEFPAIPEAILDIIPVDLVVNAMIAVAATPPTDGREYYHVCSGSRQPLRFRELYEHVREYFQANPFVQRGRGEIPVPTWTFPGGRRVEQMLRAGERLVEQADKAITRLPRSGRVRSAANRLDRERGRLEFMRRYSDLYGSYTEIETVYTDHRMLALFRSLPEEDQRDFGFDPAIIDWRHYLVDVHTPSVASSMRAPRPARPAPVSNGLPAGQDILAVFDMDGTIVNSNVVESYLWLRLAETNTDERLSELSHLARRMPRYLAAERRDRGEFLRTFYRRYEGASVEAIDRLVDEHITDIVLARALPGALRRVRQHRAAGHRTV